MTAHLLAAEIGPVYEFIVASRKTRDLWFASWAMSEVAKAVARAVAEGCGGVGALIIPAVGNPADLDDGSRLTVADQILAEVPAGTNPAEVARAAKDAAHDRWIRLADQAVEGLPRELLRRRFWGDRGIGRPDVWEDQMPGKVPCDSAGEVIECYAAWVPRTEDYRADRLKLMRLLDGRTACRDFPPAQGRAGLPKSSLDGARETVLAEIQADDDRRRRFRLTIGEQLDAPGLVRRLGGGKQHYPSVARIAADPWLRGASRAYPGPFDELRGACSHLATRGVITRIGEGYPELHATFPFEGAVVYGTRHRELVEEYEGRESSRRLREPEVVIPLLGPLRARLKALTDRLGEPEPYYAVLVADGDNVGKALDAALKPPDDQPETHRQLARDLSGFADEARAIILGHHGAPVFVGGDDVLAFLPVDRAIACAADLNAAFGEVRPGLTISAGIAIVHFLDSLEDAIAAARDAGDKAKEGKPALAIDYRTRGGAPVEIRGPWAAKIDGNIHAWADLIREGVLPTKVAHDLRELARVYEKWDEPGEALRADVRRLMSGKGREARELIESLTDPLDSAAMLHDLAGTLLVARRIARARDQAEPGPAPAAAGAVA